MKNTFKSFLIVSIFVSQIQAMAFYDGFDMSPSDVESLIMQNEIDLSQYYQKQQKIMELQNELKQIDLQISAIVQQLNSRLDLGEQMQFESMRVDALFQLEKLLQTKEECRRQMIKLR